MKDVNLDINQGEVFTVLGHNGAGKTTLIYLIAGMHAPTEGNAFIYNLNIRKDLPLIQQQIGLCQQFDVLFENLTVEEHLVFVCDIKNMPKERMLSSIE